MEFKEYTDGKRTIRATVVTYEAIYRAQGFKPAKTSVRRGSGNTDNVKSDKSGTDTTTEQGLVTVPSGEVGA